MSTRSAIIAKIGNTYKGIYCHSDGYPSYNGNVLLNHYKDDAKIQSLIALGDISSLSKEVAPQNPANHKFNGPSEDGVTLAYHRDRGEELFIRIGKTAAAVAKKTDHNGHVYLWEDGKWHHNGDVLTQEMCAD